MKKITTIITSISFLGLSSFYALATDPTIAPLQQDPQPSGGINWAFVAIAIFFIVFGGGSIARSGWKNLG